MGRIPTSRELELWRAYESTVFRVSDGGREISFQAGILSPDVDQLLERFGATTWAHITAWNPASIQLSTVENEGRQRRLVVALEQGGWIVLAGDGVDPSGRWPPEPTAFVVGMGLRDAQRLGHEYGQLAIVAGRRGSPARLVACDPELAEGLGNGRG